MMKRKRGDQDQPSLQPQMKQTVRQRDLCSFDRKAQQDKTVRMLFEAAKRLKKWELPSSKVLFCCHLIQEQQLHYQHLQEAKMDEGMDMSKYLDGNDIGNQLRHFHIEDDNMGEEDTVDTGKGKDVEIVDRSNMCSYCDKQCCSICLESCAKCGEQFCSDCSHTMYFAQVEKAMCLACYN